MNLSLVLLTIIFYALFMSGFATIAAAHEKTIGATVLPWMKSFVEKNAGESNQVLLVIGGNPGFSAKIYPLERHNGHWDLMLKPIDASMGRNGFALPDKKREGDGRTPSGVYPLKFAFGYPQGMHTKMNYFQTTEDDVWVDDADSVDYNQLLKRGETKASSFEDMRRNDNMYKYGIVIGYNTNPVDRGLGSAIFFHVWRGKEKSTAGCIAMSEEDIVTILEWLDPSHKPLVMMGTAKILKGIAKKKD
ncbi:MAG: L,D-transpeptidase family protein [Proteobacteria bacterium]|nr:L,D-transpeptidase family protein [Pseudomonadota bacterium]